LNKRITRKTLLGGNSHILNVLESEFQKGNPNTDRAELFDIRPLYLDPMHVPERPNHYLLSQELAQKQKIGAPKLIERKKKLFGLLLMDDSLFAVKRVLVLVLT